MPAAIITGVNGQDGSYFAELLLGKGYRVVGTIRNRAADQERILHIRDRIELVESDLHDQRQVENLLHRYSPDEVCNLAAQASSSELWTNPVAIAESNGLSVMRLLEAIDRVNRGIRFVQASSSELFANSAEAPQTESTAFHPRNPYGVAKAFGHWTTAIYREQRGLFACSCILYNHESPRRGMEFVTRKISRGVARIKLGLASDLRLGDLDARRDWGFAGDYVQAMWLALQQPVPDDYVVATGKTHSVREFCEIAFSYVGLNYQDYVVQDNVNVRPPEAAVLVGNPGKAQRLLGWKPTMTFPDLVQMMVDADLKALRNAPEQLTSLAGKCVENSEVPGASENQ